MKTTLTDDATRDVLARLRDANARLAHALPGEPEGRQPVHTVYGGAHLFRADMAKKLGRVALASLEEHAPDFATFGRAFGLTGHASLPTRLEDTRALLPALVERPDAIRRAHPAAWLAHTIRSRVVAKLEREPVEDFRIDFEDGFGARPDAEEDATAIAAANELARGLREGLLPPFVGIRIKALAEETRARSVRTLDLFLTALVAETGGVLPPNFVVTLPKVSIPEQVTAAVELFALLEGALGLPPRALALEIMIESTSAIVDAEGRFQLSRLLAAADGRCRGAHFGTYDYTASCDVIANHQTMTHPASNLARGLLQIAFARTGVFVSDGATNVMPVPVHRAPQGTTLSLDERLENRARVHAAWKLQFDNVQDGLMRGLYQGWDLHPAQLPARFAAVHAFFLEGLEASAARLQNFVARAAQATLVGDVFDDAATGQGLLNFFLRAIHAGAMQESEVLAHTGLTVDELRLRSFAKILATRAGRTG